MASEFHIRPWELDLLSYTHFCALESAIWEAKYEADRQKNSEG